MTLDLFETKPAASKKRKTSPKPEPEEVEWVPQKRAITDAEKSTGCLTLKRCTHDPCLCAMAWGVSV